MQSADLNIRTERGVIEVVLDIGSRVNHLDARAGNLEREFISLNDNISGLRTEFRDTRQETNTKFTQLQNELRIIEREISGIAGELYGSQISTGWYLAAGALLAACLPYLRRWLQKILVPFTIEDISRMMDEKISDALKESRRQS